MLMESRDVVGNFCIIGSLMSYYENDFHLCILKEVVLLANIMGLCDLTCLQIEPRICCMS